MMPLNVKRQEICNIRGFMVDLCSHDVRGHFDIFYFVVLLTTLGYCFGEAKRSRGVKNSIKIVN